MGKIVARERVFSGEFPSPHNSPKFIMLPNEEFALACRAYYEEQGLIVDETNGEFAHCPYPEGMGESGYYLLHDHHQQQGLLQSRDVGKRCFWVGDVKNWLLKSDYFPDNFFELWDIYDEFSKPSSHVLQNLHSPENRVKQREQMWKCHTPEARAKRGQSLRKAYAEGRKKVNPATHEKKRKPVEVTFPSGRVGVFPSMKLATFYLGCDINTLNGWIVKGFKPSKHFKGYSARFV
jgi:hypothetical protein